MYSHRSQEAIADNHEQTDGSDEIPEMENEGEIKNSRKSPPFNYEWPLS